MSARNRTGRAVGSVHWTLFSTVLLVAGAVAVAAMLSAGAEARSAALPANVSPPTIAGSAIAGETLTAGSGSWSGTAPITFDYAWQLCDAAGAACAPIAGASGLTYVVATGDVGSTLRVRHGDERRGIGDGTLQPDCNRDDAGRACSDRER